MALTEKDCKFLTILNETRLANGKMFQRDSKAIQELFTFTDEELDAAVKKLTKLGMLSKMEVGGNEIVYFHTEKVHPEHLDKKLSEIRR